MSLIDLTTGEVIEGVREARVRKLQSAQVRKPTYYRNMKPVRHAPKQSTMDKFMDVMAWVLIASVMASIAVYVGLHPQLFF